MATALGPCAKLEREGRWGMWGRFVVGVAVLFIVGCGGDDTTGVDGGGPRVDAGPRLDGGPGDGGRADAGAGDSGAGDAGSIDAAAIDGGGTDAGPTDAGLADAGADAGALDAGPGTDAGPSDAATPDGGTCIDPAPTPDRPVATTCSPCRPDSPDPGGSGGMCSTHADCTAGPNGRCSFGMIGAFCSYDDCFTDADCAAGEVCSCDGAYFSGANVCVPANCHVNSDCTSGRCSPSYGCLVGGGPEGWYCHTAADACAVDADCSGSPGGRCAYDTTTRRWACEFGICIP